MRFLAVFSGSMARGRKPRVGEIRKPRATPWESDDGDLFALKGRNRRLVPPFQGLDFCVNLSQGVALGFQLFAPSGLPISTTYALETARNLV